MPSDTLWSHFERACARFAGQPAMVEGQRRWSYGELGLRVRARAAHWQGLGLEPGARVAVLDWNTAAFLECTFAAAATGAVLCPLNHRLAAPELAAILEDCGVWLLVASRTFAPRIDELGRRGALPARLLWSEDAPGAAGSAGVPGDSWRPRAAASAEALAQLYYTSGTTGRPKGVMLTQGNLCAHASLVIEELGLCADDRWGHFAPLFHLADAWATLALTRVGGLHVLLPRFEADEAVRTIEREGVTLTNLIPTMLKRLVESPEARRERFSSLRLMLSGGAPIAPALVRQVMAVLGCDYVQTYGMTETSPYLTLGLLPPELLGLPPEELLRLRARTGRPMRGVELELVDEAGQAVPADDRTVGEIRVRGPTVTPGYWQRPEETAAALREGWLYTGDLAVIDAHGLVNIVDRKKDMILSGGENVYSTEVENALYEHPDVLEAAVFGRPDPTWGESVNAAVVLRPGSPLGAEELRAHCRERLAAYKLPRSIEFLSELPKSGSGKIAKARLRERGGS